MAPSLPPLTASRAPDGAESEGSHDAVTQGEGGSPRAPWARGRRGSHLRGEQIEQRTVHGGAGGSSGAVVQGQLVNRRTASGESVVAVVLRTALGVGLAEGVDGNSVTNIAKAAGLVSADSEFEHQESRGRGAGGQRVMISYSSLWSPWTLWTVTFRWMRRWRISSPSPSSSWR